MVYVFFSVVRYRYVQMEKKHRKLCILQQLFYGACLKMKYGTKIVSSQVRFLNTSALNEVGV